MENQRVRQVIDSSPDDLNVDGIFENDHLLDKIETGERQIKSGEIASHDEAKRRLEKWLSPLA